MERYVHKHMDSWRSVLDSEQLLRVKDHVLTVCDMCGVGQGTTSDGV